MTVLGIGPFLAIVGALGAAIVIALEYPFGLDISLPSSWQGYCTGVGILFCVVGVYFWLTSAFLVERAFRSHQLQTSGVYRISRHPLYAAFIVFIIPGLALILDNLCLLLISVMMFAAFKFRIGKEEEFLAQEFGDEYREYASKTAQLIPCIRI